MSPPRAPRTTLPSLIIGLFLVLQVLTGFKVLCPPKDWESLAKFRICCAPALWPFVDYPMYNKAYHPGSDVPEYFVVGVTNEDAHIVLDSETLGVKHIEWRKEFVQGLFDGKLDVAQRFIDRATAQTGTAFRWVLLENRPWVQTTEGLARGETELVRKIGLHRGRLIR